MGVVCRWCDVKTTEGFCSADCRQNFNTVCQLWGEGAYGAGKVSIFQLRICLGRSLHRAHRDPARSCARPKAVMPATENVL